MPRKKPSIRIKNRKNVIEIWKTHYDELGRVIRRQVDTVSKK